MAAGGFCRVLLASADPAGTTAFYSGLAGWEPPVEQLDPELQKHGVPSHWRSFVGVDDIEATAARASELGGTVLGEPRELPDGARVVPVFDPQGAAVALRQAPGDGDLGAVCLVELNTRDVAAARDFYVGLFDWEAAEDAGYVTFSVGGSPVAGLQAQSAAWGDAPPNWLPYLPVESCEEAIARVEQLGGRLVGGPDDHPRGRFAVAHDAQDAVFGVLSSAGAGS